MSGYGGQLYGGSTYGGATEEGATALEGVSSATSGGRGSLHAAIAFVGASHAATDSDGSLNVVGITDFEGVSSSANGGRGSLHAAVTLEGISSTASNSSGLLDRAGIITFEGVSLSASDNRGALYAVRTFEGVSSTASDSDGSLNIAGIIDFEGASSSASDGRGSLHAVVTLKGVSPTASDGSLWTGIVTLEGVSPAASDGSLRSEALLSGVSPAANHSTGAIMGGTVVLTGAANAASSATAPSWAVEESPVIVAPSVDTLYKNSWVGRLYAAAANQQAFMTSPANHRSVYGLIWDTPGRAADTYRPSVGPTGEAESELQTGALTTYTGPAAMAAHTVVLKPLNPEATPDPDAPLPGATPPGGDDGTGGAGGGGSGIVADGEWEFSSGDGGDGGGGGTGDPVRKMFLRGVMEKSYESNAVYLVDANNSFIYRFNESTGDLAHNCWLNPGGWDANPDANSDGGAWQLRDITWDGSNGFVVRRSDETLLRLDLGSTLVNSCGVADFFSLAGMSPTGVAWDGSAFWVHSTSAGRLEQKNTAGDTLQTASHPWATPSLAGIGWDDEDAGHVWLADPLDASIRQVDVSSGAVGLSRGWDADEQRPQSVHREGNVLWVCSENKLFKFIIFEEPGVVRRASTFYEHYRDTSWEDWL